MKNQEIKIKLGSKIHIRSKKNLHPRLNQPLDDWRK